MDRLYINFSDPNTGTVHLGENCDDPRIEIKFRGPAQLLTRRAKAEVVTAVRDRYLLESQRLSDNRLVISDVWNDDGTLGREAEEAPLANPITGEVRAQWVKDSDVPRFKGLVNRTVDDSRALTKDELEAVNHDSYLRLGKSQ